MKDKTTSTNDWREKLNELIDNNYWSYPEDERSMIFTTKKIEEFVASILLQQREKTKEECLEAVKSPIEFVKMKDWDIDSYQTGHADAVLEAITNIKKLK